VDLRVEGGVLIVDITPHKYYKKYGFKQVKEKEVFECDAITVAKKLVPKSEQVKEAS
jgi:hypothetical protein